MIVKVQRADIWVEQECLGTDVCTYGNWPCVTELQCYSACHCVKLTEWTNVKDLFINQQDGKTGSKNMWGIEERMLE